MVKFEVAVEINRPIDEVFAYMADPTKTPEWNSIVEEARPSETPVRRGTTISSRARFLGRKIDSTFEVVEYVPNKTFVQRTDKPFPFTITNVFEAAGKATRVKGAFEGEPGGFFKLGEPILARIAKKQFQAQLDTAKELLEARTPAEVS
jgi:uncharacterized protein YndB with AHSA1/START domain